VSDSSLSESNYVEREKIGMQLEQIENFPWEDFDKLHVIRRMKEVVGKWWGVQLNYTDSKGFLRGVPKGKFFNPIHQVCKDITKNTQGFHDCMGTVKKTTLDSHSSRKTRLSRCHAGFSTISVPIFRNAKYLGCIFGDGFLVAETADEQKVQIKNYLRIRFPQNEKIQEQVDELPVLSEKELAYLTELIEMVVAEILMVYSSLSEAKNEVAVLRSELSLRFGMQNMIGKSPIMKKLYEMVEKVAESTTTVLVEGENGTGKELIARALHYNSKRRKEKFIPINCGAFNENLLGSELFGYVKGAFTGAAKDKVGLFEAAQEGTLFLDEVGETSMSMQVKLLRVLQEGTFTPVGSTEVRTTNARIVCATNRNLEEMVKKGEFREDLFFRLNVINLVVPPLRERKEDIPLLLDHFLEKFAKAAHASKKIVPSTCLQILLNYDWPGNVREFENEIERLCVLAGDETTVSLDHFSTRVREGHKKTQTFRLEGKLKDALEALELQMIKEGLERVQWNKSKLAKELGISRAGLIMKVEKYGLEKDTNRKAG
jgi:two-component system response regulator HupR/HoxA